MYKRLTVAAANVISYVKTIPYPQRSGQYKVLKFFSNFPQLIFVRTVNKYVMLYSKLLLQPQYMENW